MNQVRPDKNNDVLCTCSGTTDRQIRRLIDEGITDPERLSRITGACSGCGSCEPALMSLLNTASLKEPLV
ncbi:(2Fe-2S)-binding protein [Methylotuvimicrobium alcaliphilum]|uniref:(2Fe-2S)-binding protein n=1 Tax=Methylotuvimicrobium alcaliphilum TaxID=271065 RepID=UPI00031634E1|nr:(2Fe-2S)-binding protein [Methylotuvimicrobium alcaliphilum]